MRMRAYEARQRIRFAEQMERMVARSLRNQSLLYQHYMQQMQAWGFQQAQAMQLMHQVELTNEAVQRTLMEQQMKQPAPPQ